MTMLLTGREGGRDQKLTWKKRRCTRSVQTRWWGTVKIFCKVSNGVTMEDFEWRWGKDCGSDKTFSAVLPVKVIRTYACHCVWFESSCEVKGMMCEEEELTLSSGVGRKHKLQRLVPKKRKIWNSIVSHWLTKSNDWTRVCKNVHIFS